MDTVVNQGVETETPVNEDEKINGQGNVENPEEAQQEPAQAGDKTDPNLLLKSLREERERRRLLEERVVQLESSVSSESTDNSTEDMGQLRTELSEIKSKLNKREILDSYPVLKEIWQEFEEFRDNPDNKGMNLKTSAKAFLVEKGLLEPSRKGLEKGTGGTRVPMSTGMTTEEIKKLRETNYRKYEDMLMKGQIKFSS